MSTPACGQNAEMKRSAATISSQLQKKSKNELLSLKIKKLLDLKLILVIFAYWVGAIIATSSYCFIIENYLVIVKVIFFMSKFCPKGKGINR